MENTIGTSKIASLIKVSILALGSIVFFGAGLWLWEEVSRGKVLSSIAWFHLSEIKIKTEWPLNETQVRAWLPPLKGKSLLALDARSLITMLEEKNWVASVTLKKEYPDTLRLELKAKKAAAIAVFRGKPYFIDEKGERIERTTPALLKAFDLPVISFEKEKEANRWAMADFLSSLSRLQKALEPGYTVSQVTLTRYPYFRIYLSRPRWEVLFSLENWESQFPMLLLLLHHPPRQIQEGRRFNLVFPKKLLSAHRFRNKLSAGVLVTSVRR